MINNIIPLNKTLPAIQVVSIVDKIISHSQNMERIKQNYHLAQKEIKSRFNIEMKRLENDISRFKEKSKQQREHFKYGHKERMKMLNSVDKLSKEISKSNNPQVCKILENALLGLLEQYEKNQSQFVGYYSKNKEVSYKGDQ